MPLHRFIEETIDKDKWFLWRFITAKILQRQDWINLKFADI